MKKQIALFLVATGFCVGCASQRPVSLFNGRDLTGFYTFLETKGVNQDPEKVFTVQDGMIHVSGKEFGYLATEKEFGNYHLSVEFKWGPATHAPRVNNARDNGILFHMSGPDKIWPKSLEFQIIEGGTGDLLLVEGTSIDFQEAWRPRLAAANLLSPDGRRVVKGRVNWAGRSPVWKDTLGIRGAQDLERPVGEWNLLELVTQDGSIGYTVNGTVVLKGTGATPQKGRILLQSEGAEVFFRNLQLSTKTGLPE